MRQEELVVRWAATPTQQGLTLSVCVFTLQVYTPLYPATLLFLCREQELSNLLDQGKHSDAVGLAIALDHPKRVLTILTSLLEEGEGAFRDTIAALREDQTSEWMRCTLSHSVCVLIVGSGRPTEP